MSLSRRSKWIYYFPTPKFVWRTSADVMLMSPGAHDCRVHLCMRDAWQATAGCQACIACPPTCGSRGHRAMWCQPVGHRDVSRIAPRARLRAREGSPAETRGGPALARREAVAQVARFAPWFVVPDAPILHPNGRSSLGSLRTVVTTRSTAPQAAAKAPKHL
jgi:hypothetical protein